jgi:outer membrane autotransporter protein
MADLAGSYAGIYTPNEGFSTNPIRWRVGSGEAKQVGTLSGVAPFIKDGAGTLRLASSGFAYTGDVQVQQGTLVVDEQLSGRVRVLDGARLQAVGPLAGVEVARGGTFTVAGPGTSLSILSTLTGDPRAHALLIEPEATLELEVAPTRPLAHPYLRIDGKALLDGRLMALGLAGEWQPSQRYFVLSAEDGYGESRFASVESSLPFLTPRLDYEHNSVFLQLERNDLPFEDVADTPDDKEVADVIDIPPDLPSDPPPPPPPPPPPLPEPPVPPVPVPQPQPDSTPGPDPVPEPILPLDPVAQPEPTFEPPAVAEETVLPPAQQEAEPVNAPVDLPVAHQPPTLHDHVAGMTAPQAREAFRQLGGSWSASLRTGLLDDSYLIREAALRNAAGCIRASLPVAARDTCASSSLQDARFWSEAIAASGDRDGVAHIPGDRRDTGGLVLGLSRRLPGKTFATAELGGFIGAQHSRWSRGRAMAAASINTHHAGLTLSADASAWRLDAGVAHSWHTVRSQRRVNAGAMRDAVHSHYRARTMQVFAEAALPLAIGSDTEAPITLEPYTRLAWVQNRSQAHTEEGGLAALSIQAARDSVVVSSLGLRLRHDLEASVGKARVQVEAAWHHADGDLRPVSRQHFAQSSKPATFSSHGLPLARSSWGLKLGVSGSVAKGVDVGMAYHGRYSTAHQDHGARVTVSWAF